MPRLHHFTEDVYEIVDQSNKESKIDKKLLSIRNTWSKMTVDFDFSREDCPVLRDLSEAQNSSYYACSVIHIA